MPHIWVEYSANLSDALNVPRLLRTVQDAVIDDGSIFPFAGARTRAVPVENYLIVDGHPDNGFVHVLVKIGPGRSDAEKSALGERVFGALGDYLDPLMAQRPLGISLQIEEAHPQFNYKLNNYRDYLKARAGQRSDDA